MEEGRASSSCVSLTLSSRYSLSNPPIVYVLCFDVYDSNVNTAYSNSIEI